MQLQEELGGRGLNRQAIEEAHRRLAELRDSRRLYDWDGKMFGTPVGRPEQIPPNTQDWRTWLYLGGRGTGKTRAAGEKVRQWVRDGRTRLGLIAPTAADARDVMIEGNSGLLAICHDADTDYRGNITGRPIYEPSKRRVTWQNGAMATLYTAEEPSRLRGPQHEGLWCDELCAWKYVRETWDMAQFGLRIGDNPQVIVSTTPKPMRILRDMAADPTTFVSTGSTFDNKANLAAHFIDQISAKYEGTTLGRQELYAAILDEAEGALWRREWLDAAKMKIEDVPDLARVCVSVDPAVSANEETSNETGIIIMGVTPGAAKGFVMEDCSGIYTPLGWARAVISAYHRHQADFILAEVNNGGDLVVQNIKNLDNTLPIRTVHARKGKYLRAEPIAALYEQNRVFHAMGEKKRTDNPWSAFDKKPVKDFEALEDQMVQWEPLGDLPSPDRLDALVHGLTALMIKAPPSSGDIMPAPGGKKTGGTFDMPNFDNTFN